MTSKRHLFVHPQDDRDRPADLFDDQRLETLPMPLAESEGEPPPAQRVGYGNPPAHTRWQKGGPSPNPNGRPPKRRGGKLTEMMQRIVEVDGGRQLTRRAALDRVTREKAMTTGGNWLTLWEKREAHDRRIRERVQAFHQRLAQETPAEKSVRERERKHRAGDALYNWIEQHFAGLFDTERKLLESGVIVETSDGFALTKNWLSLRQDRDAAVSSGDDEPVGGV
jgi:hypothetical protein